MRLQRCFGISGVGKGECVWEGGEIGEVREWECEVQVTDKGERGAVRKRGRGEAGEEAEGCGGF